ncbi:hypothetical protein K1T71_011876 [Dendrolimus kikuchii]|uniref:Uncharacterized protein n=1 Tax=Dendrolimus kikuchii TaxID=765133 RepID=A0ACC1CMP4_9NEOP|nr:hypothetical protein K1T71_011876 [Dendrolimus kikuchii]
MCTVTETVEEPTSQHESKPNHVPESTKLKNADACPLDCPYRKQNKYTKPVQIIFNAIGILVAILATYLIISTDSKLYLVFWICYSVLRRMMLKSKNALAKDKID